MIFNKLRIIPSLCSWSNRSNKGRFAIPKTRVALVLLGAVSLSSLAHGQPGQPAVTALPYVLTNNGSVQIVTSYTVKPVPKEAGISTFGSLFGGGFAVATSTLPLSTAAITATFATKHLILFKNKVALQKNETQLQQNAQQQRQAIDDEIDESLCSTPNLRLVLLPNGTYALSPKLKSAPNLANVHHVSSRTMARRTSHALPMLAAAETCELPEEQNADEAQAELEALNESETASEDALEAAEAAADAAEVAAEAAEAALESALEAAEILETILEACSLF